MYNKSTKIRVTEIELLMGYRVADSPDGKKRLIFSPYWMITYYAKEKTGNPDAMYRYTMTLDAYSGEVVWDDKL